MREGGREGGKDGGREGAREGGWEGAREGGRERQDLAELGEDVVNALLAGPLPPARECQLMRHLSTLQHR